MYNLGLLFVYPHERMLAKESGQLILELRWL
jgi:hypothetical protein